MTVSAVVRRSDPATGDGVNLNFPFVFRTFNEDEVAVFVLDSVTNVETQATYLTDYTVTLNGDQDASPGGTVVFAVAPLATDTVVVAGDVPYSQQTALPDGGQYRAQTVEQALDRLAVQAQQLAEGLSRAAKVPVTTGDAANLNAAIAALSANLDALIIATTNIADIITVADNIADVTAVVADAADIGAVAANSANINTVAGLSADIAVVVANQADISTVAGVSPAVVAVAADLPNLNIKVPRTSATGSAVVPTGTTAQRDGSPVAGYFRFNQTLLKFEGYNGTAWGAVGGGATGGGGDEVFVENTRTVTVSYTLPALRNAHSVGPITIDDGVVVTIPDGCRWVVS